MVQEQILEWIDDEDLTVHVVWMPVLPADTEEAAERAREHVPDPRALHYWDGDQSLGQAWREVVALPEGNDRLAWDIYLVYPRGASWGAGPPAPRDWRHQLALDERHLLDGETLRWAIASLTGS